MKQKPDSQKQRRDLWLSRGRVVGEVWMWSLELADANYTEQTNSSIIAYSAGTIVNILG